VKLWAKVRHWGGGDSWGEVLGYAAGYVTLRMYLGNVLRLCVKCHRKLAGKERRWRKRLYALLEKKDQ